MIRGNAMDVYTVAFANEEKFSLMAYDTTMARLMARELMPNSAIVAVHKIDQWEGNHA
jgi:hypothetical protein